jgi:hypothetical protein
VQAQRSNLLQKCRESCGANSGPKPFYKGSVLLERRVKRAADIYEAFGLRISKRMTRHWRG